MKNQTLILLLAIFLIGIVSSAYPGETISVNNTIQRTDLNYTISGNSTAIEGLILNVTLETINITLPSNLAPDTFTILLYYNETQQVIEVPSSSGGSGGSVHHHSDSAVPIKKTNQTIVNGTEVVNDTIGEETPLNEPPLKVNIIVIIIMVIMVIITVIVFIKIFGKKKEES
jgi:hypothetical protein